MAHYYDELLKLCGFEGDEIDREKPRIDRVFQRLELVPDDMKRGERWVSDPPYICVLPDDWRNASAGP